MFPGLGCRVQGHVHPTSPCRADLSTQHLLSGFRSIPEVFLGLEFRHPGCRLTGCPLSFKVRGLSCRVLGKRVRGCRVQCFRVQGSPATSPVRVQSFSHMSPYITAAHPTPPFGVMVFTQHVLLSVGLPTHHVRLGFRLPPNISFSWIRLSPPTSPFRNFRTSPPNSTRRTSPLGFRTYRIIFI